MRSLPIYVAYSLADSLDMRHLIIEIRSKERIDILSQYGFSDLQIIKI